MQIGEFWPSLQATHASEACVAINMSSACNFRGINFLTRALGLEAPGTEGLSFRVLIPPLLGARVQM